MLRGPRRNRRSWTEGGGDVSFSLGEVVDGGTYGGLAGNAAVCAGGDVGDELVGERETKSWAVGDAVEAEFVAVEVDDTVHCCS